MIYKVIKEEKVITKLGDEIVVKLIEMYDEIEIELGIEIPTYKVMVESEIEIYEFTAKYYTTLGNAEKGYIRMLAEVKNRWSY